MTQTIDMNEETQLILSALKTELPEMKKKKKKTVRNIFDTEIDTDPVILNIAKKSNKKTYKDKPTSKWTNSDFVGYMSNLAYISGMQVADNIVFNRTYVGKCYDILAEKLKDQMNNSVLKEYIEWWITAYRVRANTHEVYLKSMIHKDYIDRFLTRYNTTEEKTVKHDIPDDKPIDAESLYKMGGLQSVLLSRGIVITYTIMKHHNEKNIFTKISDALKKCSKTVVKNTMSITIKSGPYPKESIVDFMAIAKPSLDFFSIKDFNNVNYKELFK